jgi:hypothetical protein
MDLTALNRCMFSYSHFQMAIWVSFFWTLKLKCIYNIFMLFWDLWFNFHFDTCFLKGWFLFALFTWYMNYGKQFCFFFFYIAVPIISNLFSYCQFCAILSAFWLQNVRFTDIYVTLLLESRGPRNFAFVWRVVGIKLRAFSALRHAERRAAFGRSVSTKSFQCNKAVM